MPEQTLADRLAALPGLQEVPRAELEWLAEHGTLETYARGEVIAPKGRRVERLWMILSGRVAVRVDRGVGPRRVIEWHPGELSGMLPYSRMTAPPGDNYAEQPVELLSVHESLFPDIIQRCPTLTAQAVHAMIDRARSFNTSDLQDEKMVSLGRLAAGLAHELNNPASATVRAAKVLMETMGAAEQASRELARAGLSTEQLESIEALRDACAVRSSGDLRSPIEHADREDAILEWLERHGADPAPASALAETPISLEDLDTLSSEVSGQALDVTLRWIAAACTTAALTADIEQAATRISELVGAVKRFTHMDSRAGPQSISVEPGLRDTVRVLAAKAKAEGASVTLTVEPGLPNVRANGGELNQIWLNLLDNALDAVSEPGRIEIRAQRELDRVAVRVIDDGPGIPPELSSQIFDPFFTTKAPGQGTGLGLDIARRLARSYRGEITVESEPGRTEFVVSLPVEAEGAGPFPATGSDS